jgi:hypothetical protein
MNPIKIEARQNPAPEGLMNLVKLGMGVVIAFSVKGLVAATLLTVTLAEFVH